MSMCKLTFETGFGDYRDSAFWDKFRREAYVYQKLRNFHVVQDSLRNLEKFRIF
jgi:hypothetical protein